MEEVRESERLREEMANEVVNLELLDAAKQAHYTADAETARRIALGKRVVGHMLHLHLDLARAWLSFSFSADEHRRNRAKVRKCAMRMLNQVVTRALGRYHNTRRITE